MGYANFSFCYVLNRIILSKKFRAFLCLFKFLLSPLFTFCLDEILFYAFLRDLWFIQKGEKRKRRRKSLLAQLIFAKNRFFAAQPQKSSMVSSRAQLSEHEIYHALFHVLPNSLAVAAWSLLVVIVP